MRKSRASFSLTWPISGPWGMVGSSLSLSGVRDGVEGVGLSLLGTFLEALEG